MKIRLQSILKFSFSLKKVYSILKFAFSLKSVFYSEDAILKFAFSLKSVFKISSSILKSRFYPGILIKFHREDNISFRIKYRSNAHNLIKIATI